MTRLLACLAAALMLTTATSSATAGGPGLLPERSAHQVSDRIAGQHRHYGESAREVGREIGCKRFRRNGGGELNLDSGVCWLKAKRVSVITFRGGPQQRAWNLGVTALIPNHWWANGKGAVVTARDGNKAAARIGARRLPGVLKHS